MNIFIGNIEDNEAHLWQNEIHHCITVLRNNVGDKIIITNGHGYTVQAEITFVSKKEVRAQILEILTLPSRITPLHLAVAPTKNLDRFEFLIEKAVELGVREITPIVSFHSERKEFNFEKVEMKAILASKQALRSNFIQIHPIQPLRNFMVEHSQNSLFMAHCNENIERKQIETLSFPTDSIVIIGPEGDFSLPEIQEAIDVFGVQSLSLGPNRLRTETAALYTAAYFYSQLSHS